MAVSSITLEIDLDDAKARKALDDFNKAMAKASGQQPQTEKERLREESSALQLEALERRRQQRQEQSNRENIRYQRESIRTQIEQNRLTEAHGRLESQTNKQRSRDEEEKIATNLKRASRIKEISTPMIQGMGQVGMSFLSPSASSIVSGLSGAIGGAGQMMGSFLESKSPAVGAIVSGIAQAIPMLGAGISQVIATKYARFTEYAPFEIQNMKSKTLSTYGSAGLTTASLLGYQPQEAVSLYNQYATSLGNKNNMLSSFNALQDVRASELLGINPMAIPTFGAIGGFSGGVRQDESSMSTLAKSIVMFSMNKGLVGSQVEKLLGSISSGIQNITSKGLTIDAQSFANFALGASSTNIRGERAVQATQGFLGIADRAFSQYASNFSGLAETSMMAQAAQGAKSPMDMFRNLDALRKNPLAARGALSKLPKSVREMALMGSGLSLEQADFIMGVSPTGITGGEGFGADLVQRFATEAPASVALASVNAERIQRTEAFMQTDQGKQQLESLLSIQKNIEEFVENLGGGGTITSILDALKGLTDTIKDVFK
jgi:hypothetical protein